MLKKQISPKLVSLLFGILVICFAAGFYIFAWTEPSAAPPGSNVPPPINASGNSQTKVGALNLGDDLTAPAFYDLGDPNYFIDPDGAVGGYSVKVSGYIQGGNFRSSDGTTGLTTTVTVMQQGYGLCTLTFKDGLLTATTCP